MLLFELFDDDPVSLVDELRTLMIDVLTPLAANKVPYVTVQQVIDRLREIRAGTMIDRSLVMTVLDPNRVKAVSKIEGDRVYLTNPIPDEVAKTEDDEEREKEKIRGKARDQAKKEVTPTDKSAGDVAAKARAELAN